MAPPKPTFETSAVNYRDCEFPADSQFDRPEWRPGFSCGARWWSPSRSFHGRVRCCLGLPVVRAPGAAWSLRRWYPHRRCWIAAVCLAAGCRKRACWMRFGGFCFWRLLLALPPSVDPTMSCRPAKVWNRHRSIYRCARPYRQRFGRSTARNRSLNTAFGSESRVSSVSAATVLVVHGGAQVVP